MAYGLCRLLTALPREKLMLSPPSSWSGLWPVVIVCLYAWGIKTPRFVMAHGKNIMLLFNMGVCWRWQEIFKDWSSFVPRCLIKEKEMLLLPGLFSTGSRYALRTEPDWVATKPKSLRPGSSNLGTPRNVLATSSLWWGRLRFRRVQGELWHWHPQPAPCCTLQLAKSQLWLFFISP